MSDIYYEPGSWWVDKNYDDRLFLINSIIKKNEIFYKFFEAIDTKSDGQVIVRIKENLSASKRGTLLLDLEQALKNEVDIALSVWAESLGDKNSLRNLRGIEIKHG